VIPFLVPVKILVTVGMVLGLALVAERVSPRVAGVLSGYPLGAAIALFFIGLEIGPQFAADSAVFALAGLSASLAFVSAYYAASARCAGRAVAPATAAALAAYFAAAWALQGVPFSLAGAVLLPAASVPVFARLFRRIPNVAITRSVRFTPAVMLVRAGLAAAIILAITAAARAVGPAWAGLFSAFPTALFPLMLIVHLTYGKAHVHTIIKNFPLGLGSLIVYGVSVALGYPRLGVGWGTAAAFAAATAYLVIYGAMVSRRRR
jgi:uncharacterized membrane protein (GlpM family)